MHCLLVLNVSSKRHFYIHPLLRKIKPELVFITSERLITTGLVSSFFKVIVEHFPGFRVADMHRACPGGIWPGDEDAEQVIGEYTPDLK